jgi:hypothetical protein
MIYGEALEIKCMDADFSIELAADDPTLDFPWEDAGTALRFYDIKSQPDQLRFVDEAEKYRELHEFLMALNSRTSVLQTAKCDVWSTDELGPAEDIYNAEIKFVSYVDLVFAEGSGRRLEFDAHEKLVRRAVELLGRAPEIQSAAEFLVRRCYFRERDEVESGFYVTFYVSGYGGDESEARKSWGIGMNLAQNALLQISAEIRRQCIVQ